MEENNRELTENVRNLNEGISSLIKTLGDHAIILKASTAKVDASKAALSIEENAAISRLAESSKKISKMEEARLATEADLAASMQNLKNAGIYASSSLKSFSNALLSTEKNFAKYGDSIGSAGNAALALGKNFGLLGVAAGAVVKGFTMVAQAGLKQADETLKAKDTLSKMGAAGGITSGGLLDLAHRSGLTSKNLDLLVKPMQSLGPGLLNLGSTVGEGVKEFGKLTSITSEQREEYQRLGVSQGELIQNQSDYIALQQLSGRNLKAEGRDRASLQKASLEYTDNLLQLSAITGEDVETIKKRQQQAAASADLQIKNMQLQNEAASKRAAGDEEGAKQLEKEIDVRRKMMDSVAAVGDSQLTAAVQARLATGSWTEQSAALLRTVPNFEAFEKSLREGKDVSKDFMQAYKEGVLSNVKQVGEAAKYSKETREAFLLNEKSLAFASTKGTEDIAKTAQQIQQEQEAARKKGVDAAADARAALTTIEIKAQVELDKLLQTVNPLMSGFNATTIAATALASAAGVAAAALLAMAGIQGLGSLKNLVGDLISDWKRNKGVKPPGPGGGSGSGPNKPPGSGGSFGIDKAKYDELRKKGVPAAEAKRQAGGFKSVVKAEEKIVGKAAAETTAKVGEKALGKSLLKKIPGIGLIAGLGFAGNRAMAGDWTGAGMEMASGVAGTLPGAGTAASVGIDAALAARDIYKAKQEGTPAPKKEETSGLDDSQRTKDYRVKNQEIINALGMTLTSIDRTLKSSHKLITNFDSNMEDLVTLTALPHGELSEYEKRQLADLIANKHRKGGEQTVGGGAALATGSSGSGGGTTVSPSASATGDLIGGGRGSISRTGVESSGTATAVAGEGVDVAQSPKKILDFIGNFESKGNYNVLVGGKTEPNLTKMTVQEVLDYQKNMIKSGFQSSAVGKYQIINRTLEGLINAGAAKKNDIFNESTQDKLGETLLRQRGYDKYLSGKMSAERFANNLAMEWASLPTTTGKSHYEGVGTNKSLTSRDSLMAVLGTLPQAEKGGVLSGPDTGYPVALHGNEAVLPLDPNSIITKLLKTSVSEVEAQMKTPTNVSETATTQLTQNNEIILQLMDLLNEKLDAVSTTLSASKDTQEQLLKYTRA